jgi:hypothetical protein
MFQSKPNADAAYSRATALVNLKEFLAPNHDRQILKSSRNFLRGGGREPKHHDNQILRDPRKSYSKTDKSQICIDGKAGNVGSNQSLDSAHCDQILSDARENNLVHHLDPSCKAGSDVMISWNFTKSEWARPFIGLKGTLLTPGKQRGYWTASFGNMTSDFLVGGSGVHHLAYFNENLPEDLYRLAASLLAIHGDDTKAKRIFEQALEIDPNNVNCLSGYGMLIHSKFRNLASAEDFFKRALALAPRHVDTLCNYGAVLLDEFKKDYEVRAPFLFHLLDV